MKLSMIVCLLALLPAAAFAEDAAENQQPPQASTVHSWLELQSSGQAASEQRQPLSGAAMEKVHERYLKSFSAPIPATYDRGAPISK